MIILKIRWFKNDCQERNYQLTSTESIILNHSTHSSNDATFDWNNAVQELEDLSWIFFNPIDISNIKD